MLVCVGLTAYARRLRADGADVEGGVRGWGGRAEPGRCAVARSLRSGGPAWCIRGVKQRGLHTLTVRNFGILGHVAELRLGRLNVLVGPNGSGKSTLLNVVQFLGDAARESLARAVVMRGGIERLRTRGKTFRWVEIGVKAVVTAHAHPQALDEYDLKFRPMQVDGTELPIDRDIPIGIFALNERFTFKRVGGRGRRITLADGKLSVVDDRRPKPREMRLDKSAFGLAVLPQLGDDSGGGEVRKVQELFTTFRVFDVDARAARAPSDVREGASLRTDGSNVAGFLAHLRTNHADRFDALVADARTIVPGLADVRLRPVGGAFEGVVVDVVDRGLPGSTPLADASFGTVRALALLAMLHDPEPPLLTCVEEIDHGLHPYAFDRLVELLRIASEKTQFLIATHSPALVNRLDPAELTVCERDERTGLARIPAIPRDEVEALMKDSPYGLGELWFSGTLGGVPR